MAGHSEDAATYRRESPPPPNHAQAGSVERDDHECNDHEHDDHEHDDREGGDCEGAASSAADGEMTPEKMPSRSKGNGQGDG